MSYFRDLQKVKKNHIISGSLLNKNQRFSSHGRSSDQISVNYMSQTKRQNQNQTCQGHIKRSFRRTKFTNEDKKSELRLSREKQFISKQKLSNKMIVKNENLNYTTAPTPANKNSKIENLFTQKLYNANRNKNIRQSFIKKRKTQKSPSISIDSFEYLFQIGKGSFAKVWKVVHKPTNQHYALKQMEKKKVINQELASYIINEKQLLATLQNPFIINMSWALQTHDKLCLVMEYLDGGDLKYHMQRRRKWSEAEAKFFIANIVMGLAYLRENKIIHRDIKPANLVFDNKGYLRITDLGLSRYYNPENKAHNSGTPDYMAPQVLKSENHSYSADYFAVGIITHELMLGRRPSHGKSKQQIMAHFPNLSVPYQQLPYRWSKQAVNFINSLLKIEATERLGHSNIEQIKSHPWLSSINWQQLFEKKVEAPFRPRSIEDKFHEFHSYLPKQSIRRETQKQENSIKRREEFLEFDFDRSMNKRKSKIYSAYVKQMQNV